MRTPLPDADVRRRIEVKGIVQGVGFRPLVYQLATELELSGWVFNSSAGVTIELEGSPGAIDTFLARLERNPPKLAEIHALSATGMEVAGEKGFRILESRERPGEFSPVPPDAGTCGACWQDFGDVQNRRFSYPFTNCTHCGPRYTIVRDIPYDRAQTTMADFTLCAACRAEYDDPRDRRFHAQPNACAMCGPSLCLVPTGSTVADCTFADKDPLPAIRRTRQFLREGHIVAVKGLGGFLLACDASNDAAVRELRRRKRRPTKPFALMVRDPAGIRALCRVTHEDEAALTHTRRPIVILPRRAWEGAEDKPVSDVVAPDNKTLGVMLPYTPLHYLLFSDSPTAASEFAALVMTSGNLSEEPIVVANDEALLRLSGLADWFLLHNRDIATRVDDSVVRIFAGSERVLRRARGFAPQTIALGREVNQVLAVGAELKNTFCLTRSSHAILSQHVGDLENYETERFFGETLAKMQHLFKVSPQAIAHDLHPGYRSTRLALASGITRKFAVQHHHAHIASCMAENHLAGKLIGVAMDGTGLGSDGTIWGGEFLVADFAGFERRAHLRAVGLPGGDRAVRQPWRMALSYLRDTFGALIPGQIACFDRIPPAQLRVVEAMLERQIQTLPTSSCGRLFDAVAALLGLGAEVTFEGEAAVALEMASDPGVLDRYDFELTGADPVALDLRPMLRSIVHDLSRGVETPEIAARFHNTLSAAIVEVCCRIRTSDGLQRVCLSGGVFQNHFLLGRTVAELRRCEFGVFLHALVPANDGGIALGQAVIADELMRRG